MRIFNSVLLTEPPFFREIDGGRGFSRDSSAYPFMVEEIVSYGAVSIGVPGNSLSVYALDTLPPILKRRIKVIDKDLRIFRMDRALREPICREFGLKRISPGGAVWTFERSLPTSVEKAILCLEGNWYSFMLGLEHGLQIDVDVTRMREAALLLRSHAKDSATRGVLATIAGILAPYVPTDTGVIEMVPMESDELLQTFRALVEDETYRAISKEFHGIGFPARLRQGLSRISTLSKRLVRKREFKSIVTVGTKTITAATQVPLPDGELAERLLRKQYLPPTLSLASVLDKARKAWEISGSEFSALDFRGQQDKSSVRGKPRPLFEGLR